MDDKYDGALKMFADEEPMTNEELDMEREVVELRERSSRLADATDGMAAALGDPTTTEHVALAKRVRADLAIARTEEQALRDAMYQGHAGHSCKQIGKVADDALEMCAEAQAARDKAREEAQLWKALTKCRLPPDAIDTKVTDEMAAAHEAAEAALRDFGIDPDAP